MLVCFVFVGGIDFIMVTETLVFTATTRIQCVQLEIRDDQRVDLEIKSFSVLLNSTDPAVIMALDITTVEIEDNDREYLITIHACSNCRMLQ